MPIENDELVRSNESNTCTRRFIRRLATGSTAFMLVTKNGDAKHFCWLLLLLLLLLYSKTIAILSGEQQHGEICTQFML